MSSSDPVFQYNQDTTTDLPKTDKGEFMMKYIVTIHRRNHSDTSVAIKMIEDAGSMCFAECHQLAKSVVSAAFGE